MNLIKTIAVFISIFQLCQAFEENKEFCIRTDPALLDNFDAHENLIDGNDRCEVLATTLTLKEKEALHQTMCKDYGTTRKETYHFFQLHNGNLNGRSKHNDICDGKRNLFLAWIPYEMIQSHYAAELDPKERWSYIAKANDAEREKTELCHFRHSYLATNVSDNLFTCIVMVFEDNFYGLDAKINVLVEILPLMYELRNVTYLPWANVTTSYKTQLGKTTLKNQSPEHKQIYGSVTFSYVEKVKLNMSSIYGNYLEKLPIIFEHHGAILELDNADIGGVNIKERVYFGRLMDPKTSVNVEFIGQWIEKQQQFVADIYEYFGYGIRRFRQEMSGGEATFIRIQNTEPVFETPESSHLSVPTLYKSTGQQKFARLSAENNTGEAYNSTDSDDLDWESEEFDVPPNGQNTNFNPWSVIGGLIFGILLLSAVIGLVYACSNDEEHKYKVTGSG